MAKTQPPALEPTLEPGEAVVIDPATAPAAPPVDDRSVGDLVSELFTETGTLVRQEVQLAKTEARQELKEAGAAVGSAVAGGAVAYAGLIALVIGLGWGLGELLDGAEWLGIIIVGLIVAIIGYVLLKKGLDKIQQLSPPLDTTTQTLKEDKQWLKTQTP